MDCIGPDCQNIIFDYVAQLEHVENFKPVLNCIITTMHFVKNKKKVWVFIGSGLKLYDSHLFIDSDLFFFRI